MREKQSIVYKGFSHFKGLIGGGAQNTMPVA